MSESIFGVDTGRQWDYENGFYPTSHITRLSKMLARYELYKSIIHLPGHDEVKRLRGSMETQDA